MQTVNLYQEQFRPRRIAWPIERFLTFGALAMVCMFAWYALERERVSTLAETRAQAEQQLALWDARSAQLDTHMAKLKSPDQAQRLSALRHELRATRELNRYLSNALPRSAPLFSDYLDALARRHQTGMWLTDIEILAGGEQLRLGGSALEAQTVPDFLLALSSELAYAGRTFSSVLLNREPDAEWKVDFVLSTARDEAGS